ncbi:ABC transporter ATP-binding protein [Pseudalkalibacillus decolorationis]|uniref:ABC transporter ATP-binding protein n=1 Tax=Pseudalkalibacillus decolorationis TaxID=163879 RepID=UPI0021475F4A|nr:ABC transporter ATP-binding protein [Pseudalkalibacillus decolorationis]
MFVTQELNIGYSENLIVENLNVTIPVGKITALVGANGSGKSTILKAIARLLKPKRGSVYLDGKSIYEEKTKEVAKRLAILPQNPVAPEGLTVSELVTYGRFPHQKGFGSLTKKDKEIIEWAIEMTGMYEFVYQAVDHLSGGQRQRAWIAMAIAQDTPVLFLDEPTTFLDMAHQIEVLNLLKKLHHEDNKTIIMVVHDLNHASRYAHHMVGIKNGKVVKTGTPEKVMVPDTLENIYGVKSDIIKDPRSNRPLCLPYGLCSKDKLNQKINHEVLI